MLTSIQGKNMKTPYNRKSYLNQTAAIALISFMAFAPNSIAQSSDTTSANQDEVIVTARKRAESLLEVPVAITAFNAAELEAAAIVNLGDILDATPGAVYNDCLLYTSPSPRDRTRSRMPSSA